MRLSHEDFVYGQQLTRERIRFRRYAQRPDHWGRGLVDDAVLIGFMGEIAFAKWVQHEMGILLKVDDSNRLAGDGGIDFQLWNWGIQVKTAKSNYDDTLIKTDSDCAKGWNVLVRAHWPSQRIAKQEVGLFGNDETRDLGRCDLCGWIFSAEWDRFKSPPIPARKGSHWNYSLQSKYLKPMSELKATLESKQILTEVAS